MAIFDSIIDSLSSLDDYAEKAYNYISDDLGSKNSLLKSLARGAGNEVRAAASRGESARINRREDLMPVRTNVTPGETRWGVQQYAPNPAETERYWQSILTTFLTPNATKGPK